MKIPVLHSIRKHNKRGYQKDRPKTTHKPSELLEIYFENDIIICRLPSHISHTHRLVAVNVFGPLKTAYRDRSSNCIEGGLAP